MVLLFICNLERYQTRVNKLNRSKSSTITIKIIMIPCLKFQRIYKQEQIPSYINSEEIHVFYFLYRFLYNVRLSKVQYENSICLYNIFKMYSFSIQNYNCKHDSGNSLFFEITQIKKYSENSQHRFLIEHNFIQFGGIIKKK